VIFNALYVWNEFVFALLLLHDDSVRTLTVGVNQLVGNSSSTTLRCCRYVHHYLPMVAVYLIFQSYLVRAISAGALK